MTGQSQTPVGASGAVPWPGEQSIEAPPMWRDRGDMARQRDGSAIVILLVLALTGAAAMLLATRHGIGLSPDSVAYIDGARNLLRGNGFMSGMTGEMEAITHWPPFYPILLASLGLLGVDPLSGARLVAPLLFAGNIFLAGWLVRRHGSAGILPAVATSLLVLAAADLVYVHAWAWSEPLFVFLAALGLHHLVVYLAPPHARGRLLVAAVLIGLATLTRYVGITLIIAGAIAILWLASERWFKRGVHALLFALIGLAPLGVWTVRNGIVTGSASSRELVVNALGLNHLTGVIMTVSAWIVPPVMTGTGRRILLLGVVALIAVSLLRRPAAIRELLEAPGGRLVRMLLVFVGVYAVFLPASAMLFDAEVKFDRRILAPVHFVLLVATGLLLAGMRRGHRWMYAGVAAVVLVQVVHTASWARAAGQGLGFAGPAWRESPLWAVVAELPGDAPVYSNGYDVIYIHTGRGIKPLPAKFSTNSLRPYADYHHRLATLRADVAHNGGVVIYSSRMSRKSMPTEAELREALGRVETRRLADATLYCGQGECPGLAMREGE